MALRLLVEVEPSAPAKRYLAVRVPEKVVLSKGQARVRLDKATLVALALLGVVAAVVALALPVATEVPTAVRVAAVTVSLAALLGLLSTTVEAGEALALQEQRGRAVSVAVVTAAKRTPVLVVRLRRVLTGWVVALVAVGRASRTLAATASSSSGTQHRSLT